MKKFYSFMFAVLAVSACNSVAPTASPASTTSLTQAIGVMNVYHDPVHHLTFEYPALPVTYDYVPHYGCCEAGYASNPHGNDSLVWFYGARDGVWYYTELSFTL